MNSYKSVAKVLSIAFLFIASSCNIEPFEGEVPEEIEDTLPSSCEEAAINTADAALAFGAVSTTDSNYSTLCNAYKKALEDQVSVCGDVGGAFQIFIDSLGDCSVSIIEYEIGDIGPGGGFIFYLDGNGGGIELAPVETEFQSQWGCYSSSVDGTLSGFGKGKANTDLILQYHINIDFYNNPEQCQEFVNPVGVIQSTGDVAAKKCDDLNFNGFEDWYLPSIDELSLVYNNLYSQGFGDIDTSILASSTQTASDFKQFDVLQFNSDGVIWGDWKYDLVRYRAVRSF